MTQQFTASEAREKAVPVAWRADWPGWRQYHDEMDPLPESWDDDAPEILPLYTHPAISDAERLANCVLAIIEPYLDTGDSRTAPDWAVAIYRVLAAHSAQAQPPAASVTDGFVFERVNMGRGNERYVGLADGSEGTTVQEDGDGPGDTRSRLLWRIADAMLAAQENPNG